MTARLDRARDLELGMVQPHLLGLKGVVRTASEVDTRLAAAEFAPRLIEDATPSRGCRLALARRTGSGPERRPLKRA